jgi:leukotriene-A4 hydrolase
MENPTLTYITASFLSEDKSMVPVITHEVTHSWSGNLVSMDNWSDFWLNEGFTMFIQRKIMEQLNDPELVKLDAMGGYEQLSSQIYIFGESKSFTQLRPYLLGRDPNDAFSGIPYEKGFNFLYYLESIVNPESDIDLFRKILRGYFDKYKYKSINSEDFKEFFFEKLKEELPSKYSEILAKIDWVKWLEAPGFPPNKNDFSNKYAEELENSISLFYENKLPDDFENTFKTKWNSILRIFFLDKIRDNDRELDDKQLSFLTNNLNLKEGYNV